ncbi:MAG: D-alanyl-D-alanine carboxypeptidase [Desulfobacterales bacterium]|nr:D-alanyl-D-alanine carboxypeptidase [Desulfobacterales bacterium]
MMLRHDAPPGALWKCSRRWLLAACLAGLLLPVGLPAASLEGLKPLIGPGDAALVTDPDGRVLLAANADRQLVPASILKVLTALSAVHYLGPDFRFETDFYLDSDHNLVVRGSGDPLLVSEALAAIAAELGGRLQRFNDLVLDPAFFEHALRIPGVSASPEPYDAPNGALCVNFNTVAFETLNGRLVSAEPQTPLIPFAVERIRASGLKNGRIVLSSQNQDHLLYAGHLIRHFLTASGIQTRGAVRIGRLEPGSRRLVYRHTATTPLTGVIAELLQYSNNFIANQLTVVIGAAAAGPPGTLAKGVSATRTYAADVLGLKTLRMAEGSGISRQNRISAREMDRVLAAFEPLRHLMRHEGREYYKTGTLSGIRTRAGYIASAAGGCYRFALLVNTPGRSTDRIMRGLLDRLN